MDPLEVLHTIERRMQSIISEFENQRESLKYLLHQKWMKGVLTGDQADKGQKMKSVLVAFSSLDAWRLSLG